jgi:hypothetical protein
MLEHPAVLVKLPIGIVDRPQEPILLFYEGNRFISISSQLPL